MYDKIHKWFHNAVQGLGVACLWWEIIKLFDTYLDAKQLGVIVGMFFIGWAYSYTDKKD